MNSAADWQPVLAEDGCEIVSSVFSSEKVKSLQQQFDRILASKDSGILTSRSVAYGARNVLDLWPGAARLANSGSLTTPAGAAMGSNACVVRGLLFDKPPSRSWTLPWHRDRTIAVKDIHKDLLPVGFTNPTRKAGILHLNAPAWLLEKMLTLRISLDPMTAQNGQLVVLPGSHAVNEAADSDLQGVQSINQSRAGEVFPVACGAGDVFVMRPLLAHSSVKSAPHTQMRRRVIHLELCDPSLLPEPLAWRHCLPTEK